MLSSHDALRGLWACRVSEQFDKRVTPPSSGFGSEHDTGFLLSMMSSAEDGGDVLALAERGPRPPPVM